MNSRLESYLIQSHFNTNSAYSVALSTPLFHYTSMKSLLEIVQTNKLVLWATEVHYLNDIHEWIYAQNTFQYACNDLLQQKKIKKAFYDRIYSITPKCQSCMVNVSKDHNGKILVTGRNKECMRFISCFSTDKDSLPMWNYYGNGSKYSGCNLGTISDLLMRIELKNPSTYHAHLFRVIYDLTQQIQIIEKKILELSTLVESPEDLDIVSEELAWNLSEWSLSFKDPHFTYEQEVRLCIDFPVNNENEKNKVMKQVNYRESHDIVIPYIALELDPSILLSIKIGPLVCQHGDKKLQQEAIENMLKSRGYQGKFVSFSDCPIRF